MRIARFRHSDGIDYGVLCDQEEISFLATSPFTSLETTGATISLNEVQLLAPVEPPNILAIGKNYGEHAQETGSDLPGHPLLFLKATTTLTGPDTAIVLPREAPDEVDYEAELAVVIGHKAKSVTELDAADYILGYTCANDVSARDCQLRLDKQWARGKSFDTFCPLGPWIETQLDPARCRIASRVNGEVRQSSTTAKMIFDCHNLVSYLSQQMTLLPGTVILTGTPSGVAMAGNPPRYLKDGDTCEVAVEGIGILRNYVLAE